MNIPADLLYTEDHEWVRIEDGVATVGITDYAQSELGDIVYIEFDREVGDEVEEAESLGSIEAVKTVADFFAPVSGEIVEVNEDLEDAPETVNDDPYGKGWMAKIKVSGEPEGLMKHEEYAAHLEA